MQGRISTPMHSAYYQKIMMHR